MITGGCYLISMAVKDGSSVQSSSRIVTKSYQTKRLMLSIKKEMASCRPSILSFSNASTSYAGILFEAMIKVMATETKVLNYNQCAEVSYERFQKEV